MVEVLSIAGLQVPEIPLVEVVGRALTVAPYVTGGTALNVGTVNGLTIIFKIVSTAFCPVSGVKVYVVVCVLSKAGDQLPVIPLTEVVGRGFSVVSTQIGETALKVGIITLLSYTVIVVVTAGEQNSGFGVKV